MGISRGQTPNQKAYNKEVRRLTNAIKRGEKQGLIFPEDMLPEMPKRVTQKRIQELKKIKPKDLYLRATNFGTVYSETTTNKQRVKNVGGYGSEGYQKMINEMVKRLHPETVTLEEVESTEGLDFPTYNVIEELGYTILGLSRKADPMDLPIEVRKNSLYNFLQETASDYEDTDDLTTYSRYLETNLDTLDLQFFGIEYGSTQEVVETSFVTAGSLITQGALTPTQAEQLHTETEY